MDLLHDIFDDLTRWIGESFEKRFGYLLFLVAWIGIAFIVAAFLQVRLG
jgi:hypothetical protein